MMNFIIKLFILGFFISAGAAITCGGNMLLLQTFPSSNEENMISMLMVFWAVEMIFVFILSVYFIFFRKKEKKEEENKIQKEEIHTTSK